MHSRQFLYRNINVAHSFSISFSLVPSQSISLVLICRAPLTACILIKRTVKVLHHVHAICPNVWLQALNRARSTPLKNASSSPVTNAKSQEEQSTSEQVEEQNNPDNSRSQKAAAGFQKHAAAVADSKSAAKFESDDTTTASETNTNMMMKKKKSFSKKVASSAGRSSGGSNNNPENPVENIRKQLKKLEDLGDQLPSNETAYTVRYPFQDKGDCFKSISCIVTCGLFPRPYKFCSQSP